MTWSLFHGGLAAANASSMSPDEDIRLLLIAPAFGLAENWEGMEETGRNAWKTTGERRYTGYELDIVLPWNLWNPQKRCRGQFLHTTAIMHGRFDEVVPSAIRARSTNPAIMLLFTRQMTDIG